MYRDPAKIRKHPVRLRFSDEEYRLIQALTDYSGEQQAVILREIILDHAMEIIAPSQKSYEGATALKFGT